jgi:hypothetical protein
MTETISRNDQVPVIRDVDVLVAGCGVSGLFAALSAAREGARVFVVDPLMRRAETSVPACWSAPSWVKTGTRVGSGVSIRIAPTEGWHDG